MGFDATRRYRDRKWADIILLVVAAVVVLGAVLWATGVVG